MKHAQFSFLAALFAALAGCATFSIDTAGRPATPPTTPTAAPIAAQPAGGTFAGTEYWGKWDAANNPKELGNKVANDLLGRTIPRGTLTYPEVCTGYGSVRFAGTIKDPALLDKLTKRYEVFFTTGQSLVPRANSVDNGVFGILPMEIYRQNGEKPADKRWLDLGKLSADTEWENPTPDGLTRLSRYWVDDMFMVTALQAEAFRVTKDNIYLDRDAKEVVAYLKALQQPNGLFFHATDSPYCWGRGNGWFAAGLAEILSIMPADHPQRAAVLDGYKKMMAGLLKYQAADGMWRQLIDIDNPQNWDESSSTGMFVFSMAMGVRNGWLDEAGYKEPVKKAWIALTGHINPDGKVRDMCAGTNKAAQTIRTGPGPEMLQYYLARPKNVGDLHGHAAFIWAAWAMTMDPKPNP